MRDKRPVDQLSIEELERVLAIKRREARQKHLKRKGQNGRVVRNDAAQSKANGDPGDDKQAVTLPPELADAVDPGPAESTTPEVENGTRVEPQRVGPPPLKANGVPTFEDDVSDDEAFTREADPRAERRRRRFINTVLVVVEVVAVFGLVVLGFLLFTAREDLVETTRREQQIAESTRSAFVPTLEPTPPLRVDVNDFVLPGGHTFDEDGTPIRNVSELEGIPEHLMPRVQQKMYTPVLERPTRTPETAVAVSIPQLNLDESIVQGADWEALRQGVGQVLNGASPGDQTGNVVLAAHNDIYGELFRDLDELEPGHRFTIRTQANVYEYVVTGSEVVEPDAVEVMENKGLPTATLISCYPYGENTHRLVVYAERVDR